MFSFSYKIAICHLIFCVLLLRNQKVLCSKGKKNETKTNHVKLFTPSIISLFQRYQSGEGYKRISNTFDQTVWTTLTKRKQSTTVTSPTPPSFLTITMFVTVICYHMSIVKHMISMFLICSLFWPFITWTVIELTKDIQPLNVRELELVYLEISW